jgi:hypothetical protein
MLAKLAHGAKEATRTATKLRAMGFLQVHRIGLDFQHSLIAGDARRLALAPGTHAPHGPHWRRGHWRNQPWGPRSGNA